MVICNFVIPFILLGIRRLRTIRTAIICGVSVLIGMWLERFLIVVGTLSNPPLPAAWGDYAPSWVELSITAGTFAGMVFLYLVFVKLFPIIAIWEYEREAEG
jgi:molybdopterin-containing oxidoreductase family membrane subunit